MPIFEDVRLSWEGRDYVIPADQVLRVIARLEDVVTLGALHRFLASGVLPLAKIAAAYGIALRAAGAEVTDEHVYAGMFTGRELQKRAAAALTALQTMMIPPEAIRAQMGQAAGNARAAASRRGASSPRRTASRSDKAG